MGLRLQKIGTQGLLGVSLASLFNGRSPMQCSHIMIRYNIIVGCMVAPGMDEREAAAYFQPPQITEQQAATTRTSALIPELCCLTLGSYQPVFDWGPGRAG
ncbi:Uncharacterized protein HZ326_25603 [Fusarium oxysporum f. sp. albedinis]|nr:Uncharacterized protein HZ326_25603 [Fusarium oxysporum f. sp. albedinis]